MGATVPSAHSPPRSTFANTQRPSERSGPCGRPSAVRALISTLSPTTPRHPHDPARPLEETGRGARRRRWEEAQEAAAGAELIWGRSRTPGLTPCAGRAGDAGDAGGGGSDGRAGPGHLAGSPAASPLNPHCHNCAMEGGAKARATGLR